MRRCPSFCCVVAILTFAQPHFAQTLTPAQINARAKAQNVPEIPFESAPNFRTHRELVCKRLSYDPATEMKDPMRASNRPPRSRAAAAEAWGSGPRVARTSAWLVFAVGRRAL